MTRYDVIGDIHGYADPLTALLRRMDYTEKDGVWSHESRQAIFVGDLIDGGPSQVETIRIVRNMVEAGSAQMVLGNHEFNAICYATPDGSGDYWRPHTSKNQAQHQSFLDEVPFGSPEHDDLIAWFMTLPLWLDLGDLRVIHACWSDEHRDLVRPHLSATTSMTPELIALANTKGHQMYESVEILLKGPEVELDDDLSFHDARGHTRTSARVAWWNSDATTFRQASTIPHGAPLFRNGTPVELKFDFELPPERTLHYTGEVPVIFGHYWFKQPFEPFVNPLAACVDYSAGKGGDNQLVAYRFDGESKLSENNLVSA